MTAACLLEVLQLLENAGISPWLDGGWGVDALLQRQTRTHKDVDIVVRITDVPKLREILGRKGFAVCEGSPPDSFVLADGSGLEVDVHAVAFDDEGNGVYRMQNGKDWVYPVEGFLGRGIINGVEVRCLSATTQVLGHAHGYVPVEKDFRDMEHSALDASDGRSVRVDQRHPRGIPSATLFRADQPVASTSPGAVARNDARARGRRLVY